MKTELRTVIEPVGIEARSEESRVIAGRAAVFYREGDAGTQYQLWDDVYERILPGAFKRALEETHDARALFNHDPSLVLGRVSAKTLRLTTDKRGLNYEIDPPDTQAGRDLLVSLERGDISGSSFAFVPRSVAWRELEHEGRTLYIREIEDLDLYDVGPVTYPAYASTTAGVRAEGELTEARSEFDAWRDSLHQPEGLSRKERFRRIARARSVELNLD